MEADSQQLIEAMDARVERRNERRDLFKMVLGTAVAGGAFVYASSAAAQAAPSQAEIDVLNFALNLEYLEAQFYSYAAFGRPLAENLLTGVTTTNGPRGNVTTTGTNPPRQVDFTSDPLVGQYAREIAADEIAHVAFLRTALGSAAVAQPAINISGGINADGTPSSFTAAGRSSGVVAPTGPNGTFLPTDVFDPYANPNNFLLGSFIFEDVGVTAYKGGASVLINNKVFLEAAAGLLAVEAYHAAIVRTSLYARGIATPAARLVEATELISNARDTLSGTRTDDAVRGIAGDDDQGIAAMGTGASVQSNIAPLNSNGLAFSRTPPQVLNIVYLNRMAVSMGGFFPAGANGNIRTSAAN